MALILCHSPKGGTGTSFIAAHLSMHLARQGQDVAAHDFTYQDTLKLFFGLLPTQALAEFHGGGSALAVAGVELFSAYRLSREPDFADALRRGQSPFNDGKIYIADVAAGDRETKDRLLPHAQLHVCTLLPQPVSLAALTKVAAGTPTIELPNTAYILNQLDDTHRFSRHTHIFLRELVGDQLVGTVRRDEAVNEAAAMFEPISKYAPASAALADIRTVAEGIEAMIGLNANAEQLA